MTFASGGVRSIQLSYGRFNFLLQFLWYTTLCRVLRTMSVAHFFRLPDVRYLRRAELYTTELGQNTFFTSLRESTQELFSALSRLPLLYITHQPFRGRITFYI